MCRNGVVTARLYMMGFSSSTSPTGCQNFDRTATPAMASLIDFAISKIEVLFRGW